MTDGFAALGDELRTFRPTMSNMVAGAILGVGMIGGGIAGAVYVYRMPIAAGGNFEDQVGKFLVLAFLGLGMPLLGIFFLRFVKHLAAHRVKMYRNGFAYIDRGKTELCPWTEVAEFQEVFTEEQLKLLELPGARLKRIDRSFGVVRKDGKRFEFGSNNVDNVADLAAYFEGARDRYGIAWKQVEK